MKKYNIKTPRKGEGGVIGFKIFGEEGGGGTHERSKKFYYGIIYDKTSREIASGNFMNLSQLLTKSS